MYGIARARVVLRFAGSSGVQGINLNKALLKLVSGMVCPGVITEGFAVIYADRQRYRISTCIKILD